ncbi:MAG: hypothetical protein LCH56_09135 [Proteobacteria bacterium]|nr:hypothetical protein [Pseudomonadota bacterium]
MLRYYAHLQGTTIFGLLALFAETKAIAIVLLAIGIACDITVWATIYRKREVTTDAPFAKVGTYAGCAFLLALLMSILAPIEFVHRLIGADRILSYIHTIAAFLPTIARHSHELALRGELYSARYTAIFDSFLIMYLVTLIVAAPYLHTKRSIPTNNQLMGNFFKRSTSAEIVMITLSLLSYFRLLIGTKADMDIVGYRPGTGDIASNILAISTILLPLHVGLLCIIFQEIYCVRRRAENQTSVHIAASSL